MASDGRSGLVTLAGGAALEGLSDAAYRKRLQRRKVILVRDPEDRRRMLVPVSELTPPAYSKWLQARTPTSKAASDEPHALELSPSLQPSLPFEAASETAERLSAAIPPEVPSHQLAYVRKWSDIIGQCRNGFHGRMRGFSWHGIEIHNKSDLIRAVALDQHVGVSTINAKLGTFDEVERDAAIPADRKEAEFWRRVLPKPRPGRSAHSFFASPENDWMLPMLRSFYLRQSRPSARLAHQLLCREIDAKQRAWGAGHLYEKPTLKQCRTALRRLALATVTLGREGEKAYTDRCGPYLSRRPPEHSNDVWVTDQRLVNVRLRDQGERLGRIWVVNFLDVSSFKWLGCAFGPVLSSDMVMRAAVMALSRFGVPKAVHEDRGKEFNCIAFNGRFSKIAGEKLFTEVEGVWSRLEVRVVEAIGRNPKSKVIERWHSEIDRLDAQLPGSTGRDPGERPEELAKMEAAHERWKRTGEGETRLLTIGQYIDIFYRWCEVTWNAEHRGRGKYLRGMTPNEAFNTRRPPEGFRAIPLDRLELLTADRRTVKVARGGQVNLTFYGQMVEYEAAELFPHQGEDVEVAISRRSLRHVTVFYNVPGGKASCVARMKPLYQWVSDDREELKAAMRCNAALRRAVKRGLAAEEILTSAASPAELLRAAPELPELKSFGLPAPSPKAEAPARRRTAEEIAEMLVKGMEE
jgi:hypothetical protein